MSRPRPIQIESKAAAVRRALEHPRNAGRPKRAVREFAIANWKARRGNLTGRRHPRDGVSWAAWRSVTDKRLARRLQREATPQSKD